MVQTFKRLAKQCKDEGIGFSKCKEELNKLDKSKQKKKSRRKGSRSPSRKRRKARLTKKRSLRKKIPPKGVVIRDENGLQRSDGKKMIKL